MNVSKSSKNLVEELKKRGKELATYDSYRINQLLAQKAILEKDPVPNQKLYDEVCTELETVSSLISRYVALIDKAEKLGGDYRYADYLVKTGPTTMSDIQTAVEQFAKIAKIHNMIDALPVSSQ